jgi:hypothetical protein
MHPRLTRSWARMVGPIGCLMLSASGTEKARPYFAE